MVVMSTIACDQKLKKNPAYMLMFNLALSDIAISTVVHLFTNIGRIGNVKINFKLK